LLSGIFCEELVYSTLPQDLLLQILSVNTSQKEKPIDVDFGYLGDMRCLSRERIVTKKFRNRAEGIAMIEKKYPLKQRSHS
jgi:hypothetical protein